MITLDSIVFAITILLVICICIVAINKQENRHEAERKLWHKERQMLLDRIQAPSFAEYTSKIVREKKAEQPEDKVDPVEFIS